MNRLSDYSNWMCKLAKRYTASGFMTLLATNGTQAFEQIQQLKTDVGSSVAYFA